MRLDHGTTGVPDRLDTVEEYVTSGKQEGAKLLCGGKRIDRAGFFYEPTIFGDVDNSMRIAQEEIFGPVLAVIPFDAKSKPSLSPMTPSTVWAPASGPATSPGQSRRQGHASRDGLGQYLQPVARIHAVGWLQGKRRRPRAR